MRKIKNKFLLIFLIVGLLPLIAMGIVAIWSVTNTHRVDISSLETQLLRQKKEEIQKLLDDTIGIFQLQVGFEQKTDISLNDQEFLLNSLFETNKYLQEVSFINLRGQETKKLLREIEGEEGIELLNVSALQNFRIAKSGKDYIGPVYYTLGGPMITLSSPVRNKNSEIIMVLSGEMNLSSVQEIAGRAKLGNEGYFYVTDNSGKMLAHSIQQKLKEQQSFAKNPLVASALQGMARTGLEDSDRFISAWGQDVIGASMQLEKSGWSLVVEWPAKDAFEVIRRINFQLYTISAAAFLIILMLTFWVSRKIAKPIQILKEGSKIIGSGHFEHIIQIKTKDELEELGESFNAMAKDLATIQRLREQAIRAEALQKSLEKEKELSKSKDAFIGNASHQLRTPLATILWSLESAAPEVEKIKPDLGAQLKAAHDGTKNLNEILNDLLGVSEFGLGYHEEKREEVDVEPLIAEVAQNFAQAFESKKISYSYKKICDSAKALTNPIVFKKALAYLFDNASIYSQSVFDLQVRDEDGEIVISMRDDGIGIPADEKNMIFTQFFRAKNSIVKKNVGTGLGLFIANNIIKGLDGRIWFESQENKGTTFFIALPKKAPKS